MIEFLTKPQWFFSFISKFGISYTEDKELQKFAQRPIQDDPPKGIKFKKGTVSYAGSGPNSRTSHLFIAYRGAHSFGRELWVRFPLQKYFCCTDLAQEHCIFFKYIGNSDW